MHSSTLLTTLAALGLASAFPHFSRQEAAQPAVAAGNATGAAPAGAAAAPDALAVSCAQAMILAQGISLNIADQQQELATANTMAALLQSTTPVDPAGWAAQRTSLLQFVNNGIAIREMNQLITPGQNRATAGIAIVANAQLQELQLATSLTVNGADNVAMNLQIVKALQTDFAGGIVQNQKNMADALADCGSSPAAPAAAGAPAPPAGQPAPEVAAPGAPPATPAAMPPPAGNAPAPATITPTNVGPRVSTAPSGPPAAENTAAARARALNGGRSPAPFNAARNEQIAAALKRRFEQK